MAIESILPSDSGKVAFDKTGRNFELMDDKINVLENDRGYLTSKNINNMDDLKFNGKFIFSGEIEGITASWHVDVTSGINTHLQIATTTWDNTGNTRGITLTRIFCDGKWSGWKQLATSEQINGLSEVRVAKKIRISNDSQLDNIPTEFFNDTSKKIYDVDVYNENSNIFGTSAYRLTEYQYSTSWSHQIAYSYSGTSPKCRVKHNGAWYPWETLATTAKTDISSSDLRNSWKIDRTPTVYKIGGKIFLSGIIREGITTNDTVMMVLPEGFRPKETTYKNVIVNNLIYQIYILQNGNVVINNHNMPSNSIVRFDLSFE